MDQIFGCCNTQLLANTKFHHSPQPSLNPTILVHQCSLNFVNVSKSIFFMLMLYWARQCTFHGIYSHTALGSLCYGLYGLMILWLLNQACRPSESQWHMHHSIYRMCGYVEESPFTFYGLSQSHMLLWPCGYQCLNAIHVIPWLFNWVRLTFSTSRTPLHGSWRHLIHYHLFLAQHSSHNFTDTVQILNSGINARTGKHLYFWKTICDGRLDCDASDCCCW